LQSSPPLAFGCQLADPVAPCAAAGASTSNAEATINEPNSANLRISPPTAVTDCLDPVRLDPHETPPTLTRRYLWAAAYPDHEAANEKIFDSRSQTKPLLRTADPP
jgi:hypothetical protein